MSSSITKASTKLPKKNATEPKKTTKSSTRESSTDRTKKKNEGEEKIKTSLSKTSVNKNISTTSKTKTTAPKIGSKSTHDLSKKTITNTKTKDSPAISSSKVVRQPYFPSKNLYSNALKATRSQVIPNLDSARNTNVNNRDKTSKLVKIGNDARPKKYRDDSSSEASTISERPRTATLRKPSIVNANIVGPEAPKSKYKKATTKNVSPHNFEELDVISKSPDKSEQYESDFDSYESDFEKYSSSNDSENVENISGEETSSISSGGENNLSKSPPSVTLTKTPEHERKLDSGTFDLADFKYKHMLGNIKESIDKENSKIVLNNPPSLSDEGFEEQKSLQFINFADAHKKCEKKKENALRKKRGDEILSMIRLDYVNFTVFDLPAVSYDEYIKSYGNSNAVQTSVQTGEDNISEEVQTDVVEYKSKFTQMPVVFTKFEENCDTNFWNSYKAEYLGVGTDDNNEQVSFKLEYDESKLSKFLNTSVDLVLDILAEENIQKIKDLKENKRGLPFSDGFLEFNTSEDVFTGTKLQLVAVFPKNTNKFLSIHVKTVQGDFFNSMICVWDISNYESPQNSFVSFGKVTCCTLSIENSDYIFAGEEDGSILVWDTKEHSKSYDISNRTPTIRTGVGRGHCTKVVAVESFRCDVLNGAFEVSKFNEICTLDQDGTLIFWNLFTNSNSQKNPLVLLKTEEIHLQTIFSELVDVQCTDMILDKNDIYISTNYGDILHYSIDGARCKVKKFSPAGGLKSESTCLNLCPFSPAYFISGSANGNLSLHSRTSKIPLKVLSNRDDLENSSSLQLVHCSKTKPFVLYAKDSNNVLHIWDLSKSEVYPEFSIPFAEKVTCLKLSPVVDVERKNVSYMIIGTENGNIYLHILNKKYGQENFETYKSDVATFLNYVSRL